MFHSNGVTDTQGVDTTKWLARPLSISTSGAATNWSTGTYKYDGAGNITKMGTDWFQYDPVSRLVRGVVHDGLMGGGNEKQQAYTFDTYGNITGITTTAGGSSQHLDHLGTPRLITNAAAQKVAYHAYYPFGEEATADHGEAPCHNV